MATVDFPELRQDRMALSVGHALAMANETARARGTDPANSLVTITEESSASAALLWRIHYGPRNPIGQRGGDLIVVVNADDGKVQCVVRGQ